MTKKELRRKLQEQNNAAVEQAMQKMQQDIYTVDDYCKGRRLRSCSATVYSTDNYFILQSYRTVVACIDKRTDTCYDFLRKVYGYTATSAQHIAKFCRDYGTGSYGCREMVRWEYVGR